MTSYLNEKEKNNIKQIYEDCYYNKLDNKEYNCVKNYLHKIVKHYYLKIKNVYYEGEINSFYPILLCFDKLIEENNLDNIDDVINFIFLINKFSVGFDKDLYALMSPNNYYKDNQDDYFNVINNMFWTYETKYKNINAKDTKTRIQDIMECYMKYYRMNNDPFGDREINYTASRIGAIFYLSDKSIEELDNIYNYLFSNYEEIKENFILNSDEVETNYYNAISYFIMNHKIKEPKILIK